MEKLFGVLAATTQAHAVALLESSDLPAYEVCQTFVSLLNAVVSESSRKLWFGIFPEGTAFPLMAALDSWQWLAVFLGSATSLVSKITAMDLIAVAIEDQLTLYKELRAINLDSYSMEALSGFFPENLMSSAKRHLGGDDGLCKTKAVIDFKAHLKEHLKNSWNDSASEMEKQDDANKKVEIMTSFKHEWSVMGDKRLNAQTSFLLLVMKMDAAEGKLSSAWQAASSQDEKCISEQWIQLLSPVRFYNSQFQKKLEDQEALAQLFGKEFSDPLHLNGLAGCVDAVKCAEDIVERSNLIIKEISNEWVLLLKKLIAMIETGCPQWQQWQAASPDTFPSDEQVATLISNKAGGVRILQSWSIDIDCICDRGCPSAGRGDSSDSVRTMELAGVSSQPVTSSHHHRSACSFLSTSDLIAACRSVLSTSDRTPLF